MIAKWILPTIIAILFAATLIFYYALLPQSVEWTESDFRDKIELVIAPLPIAVGLIGVLIGYFGARRSADIAQQTFKRSAVSEVRATFQKTTEMYSKLLIVAQHAYTEIILLAHSLPSKQQGETPDATRRVMSRLITHYSGLASIITEIFDILRVISLNSFANRCYREKWIRRHNELMSTKICEQFGLMPAAHGDYLATSAFLRAGAIELQSTLKLLPDRVDRTDGISPDDFVSLFHQPMAMFQVVREAEEDIQHQYFLFLGSLIKFGVETKFVEDEGDREYAVFYGAAVLADLILSVPDQKDIKRCLIANFENDDSLMRIAQEYPIALDPRSAAPNISDVAGQVAKKKNIIVPNDGRFTPVVADMLRQY